MLANASRFLLPPVFSISQILMVFVDTRAWFAAVVPSDPNHPQAASWLAANSEVLITTDYVIDEILTLLRAR
jgi:uncharacterized protein